MGSYTKIKNITICRFNNAEYLAFMNGVLGIVAKPEAIGVSADFIAEMEAELEKLADVVNESRIAQETEAAAVHEANRSNLATYIFS